MNVIVVYKDGSVFTLCDVIHFSFHLESVFRRPSGPYFSYELDIPRSDCPDWNEGGRLYLSDIDSLEVFEDV